MQHVAQTSESDIKLESEINNVPKVGNSSTPSSPRSPPCSPPCTPPDTPPDRLSDSFQYLSDSSGSGDEDISEVSSRKRSKKKMRYAYRNAFLSVGRSSALGIWPTGSRDTPPFFGPVCPRIAGRKRINAN